MSINPLNSKLDMITYNQGQNSQLLNGKESNNLNKNSQQEQIKLYYNQNTDEFQRTSGQNNENSFYPSSLSKSEVLEMAQNSVAAEPAKAGDITEKYKDCPANYPDEEDLKYTEGLQDISSDDEEYKIMKYVQAEDNARYSEYILERDPQLQKNYKTIKDAISNLSSELGVNGFDLIQKRVQELGNNKVNALDVMKIIQMESDGRVYDPNNPNQLLRSYKGTALGPCQLKESAVDFVNRTYNKNLDINNPYDNIDACILYLRYIAEKNDTINGKVMAGYYHDGPWANSFSDAGKSYMNQFAGLSYIDAYPELYYYMDYQFGKNS